MTIQPVRPRIFRLNNVDGRVWVICALIAYFLAIALAARRGQYAQFWRYTLGVPVEKPPFLDAWGITTALTCSRKGLDVLIANPCDPNGRTFNYPRIWLFLGQLGIEESQTIALGFACGFLFFALALLLVGQLNVWQALVYSVIFCSPPVMLAVERGNNDVILYILHVGALFLLQNGRLSVRSLGYGLLLFTAMLKYYPIFTLGTAFKEQPRLSFAIIGSATAVFGLYLIAVFRDFSLNIRSTPVMVDTAFGSLVLFQRMLKFYPDLAFLSFLNSSEPGAALAKTLLKYLPIIIGLTTFLILWLRRRSRPTLQDLQIPTGLYLDAFRLGAGIYIISFCFGNSFDYRLIFLTFTLPQILIWVKGSSPLALMSRLAIGGMIVALWLSPISYRNIDEVLNWLLVFYLEYMFILTLPDWMWREPKAKLLVRGKL